MVRKRNIISFFITLIILCLTNQFWLDYKPLKVQVHITGDGSYELVGNLQNGFHQYDQSVQKIKTKNGSANVEFEFLKAKIFDKIIINSQKINPSVNTKIGITRSLYLPMNSGGGNRFKIENIEFRAHKYDAKQCQVRQLEDFSMQHTCNIKGHASSKFQFEIFVIILILSYLLAYKLVDYLADFKSFKNKSRIEIVFLVIFFTLLFIPMSNINTKDNVSNWENRNLATWHPLIEKDYKINYNFGKDYDKWYNDRFYLRKFLVRLCNSIKYKLDINIVDINKVVYFKKSGYYLQNVYDWQPFSQKYLEEYGKNLNKFSQYCRSKGIKLYIVIPPSKSYACRKYDLRLKNLFPDKRIIGFVDYLVKNYNLNVIYPEILENAGDKNDYFYYKSDHHLTDYGSYILYENIMRELIKDFKDLKTTPLSDYVSFKNSLVRYERNRAFDQGCEYKSLGIDDKSALNTDYTYYEYKYPERISVSGKHPHLTHTNKYGKYKLMLFGDSFQENLVYFLNTNFEQIEKFRVNATLPKNRKYEFDMEKYYDEIEKFKPDVIILMRNSGNIRSFGKIIQ